MVSIKQDYTGKIFNQAAGQREQQSQTLELRDERRQVTKTVMPLARGLSHDDHQERVNLRPPYCLRRTTPPTEHVAVRP
jgi:hypothetical protein